jgi:hypothetical protein
LASGNGGYKDQEDSLITLVAEGNSNPAKNSYSIAAWSYWEGASKCITDADEDETKVYANIQRYKIAGSEDPVTDAMNEVP